MEILDYSNSSSESIKITERSIQICELDQYDGYKWDVANFSLSVKNIPLIINALQQALLKLQLEKLETEITNDNN